MKTVRLCCILLLSTPLLLQADEGRTEISQGDLPMPITAPGSYILTQNLDGAGLVDAITISSSDVTLDLNGFQLDGNGATGDAVSIDAVQNVIVRNGIIRGWLGDGISASSASTCVFEDLVIRGNTLNGLRAGSYARIHKVTSTDNNDDGIVAGTGSIVRNCNASRNGTDSIGNGITVSDSCTIADNITVQNATYQIFAQSRNRIERNLCECDNSPGFDAGIRVEQDYNLLRDNHATGCPDGFFMPLTANDNILVGNTSADNSTDFDLSSGNMLGEETNDINSTNNVNAGHAFMNLTQ